MDVHLAYMRTLSISAGSIFFITRLIHPCAGSFISEANTRVCSRPVLRKLALLCCRCFNWNCKLIGFLSGDDEVLWRLGGFKVDNIEVA